MATGGGWLHRAELAPQAERRDHPAVHGKLRESELRPAGHGRLAPEQLLHHPRSEAPVAGFGLDDQIPVPAVPGRMRGQAAKAGAEHHRGHHRGDGRDGTEALVKQVSDRVAVMYLGKLAEVGPGEGVYRQPMHPYTRALLDSVPGAATARPATIRGEPPSPVHPPSGCRFRTRCPRAEQRCADEEPAMRELAAGHSVACHFPLVPVADTTVRSEEKIGETPS